MNDKQLVAIHAAQQVRDGMLIGLGTGSTADLFIEELARRYLEEGLKILTVSSSIVSAIKAKNLGLPLVGLETIETLDLYVDGADEVAPDLTLLKGQGADLVREKLLARASQRFIVLIDQSKLVNRIGEKFAIPIEVMPFAWQLVKNNLKSLGGAGDLRKNANNNGYAMTTYGSLILDMQFEKVPEIEVLNYLLNATPGVVEHGIFQDLANVVYLAEDGKVQEMLR